MFTALNSHRSVGIPRFGAVNITVKLINVCTRGGFDSVQEESKLAICLDHRGREQLKCSSGCEGVV